MLSLALFTSKDLKGLVWIMMKWLDIIKIDTVFLQNFENRLFEKTMP